MTAQWKDASSSRRNVWEIEVNGMWITVHRWADLDAWFGTCHDMGVEAYPLASADIDAAKAEFLTALHKWSQQTTAALAALLDQS